MPDKIKDTVGEYWKAFVETLIIGILLVAFSQTNSLLLFFAVIYSIADIVIMIYSACLGDPKYIIVELLSRFSTRGSR